ncbi:tRNA pseudouridine synthase Pus10 [Gadus morhua]|uniref:tRNA pseudouridine synthase Pus10 n=1 Tax=Gadus morhua TaxID=8049 RepID=UPI0011B712EC|nr:putative tRNA pseudouridine synthase Pus10 [Gadus morhua]XP_030208008.1 putative tRNA pseudouridine synthase Pus10 [Gadus morhua]XP_030208009.1 putative tRNA pseudouridine synthase Pus10 [Gadus morhua]
MLPLKEKDKPVVQKLLSSGCCARCVLRFCCVLVQSLYRQPVQDTLKQLQDFVSDLDSKTPNESTAVPEPHPASGDKSHDATEAKQGEDESEEGTRTATEQSDDPPKKRMKLDDGLKGSEASAGSGDAEAPPAPALSHCVVCLGVLQEYCSRDHARKVAEAVKTEDYHFETILLSVSLPAQLCVREHSCWLHVKKEMREKVMTRVKDDIVPLKEAFKWSVQGLIATELGGVSVVTRSAFEVGMEFKHSPTDSDCHFLATTCPDCFRPTKNKDSVFTRAAVIKALEKIPDSKFLIHYPTPPGRPTSICTSQAIQCLHTSIYVAGRYNKYSRSLSQTPWIIDGRRMMESSVEELIAEPLASSFRSKGFNFSSSGREDVDVRTLGKGRPFAMEMLNPHRYRFTKMEMKKIQETINTSSDKIAVRDLQIVTRECMGHMKEGEEEKTKSYTALVWTQKPIEKDDIIFLDDIKELTLDQKTPLRVLHRRALAVRQRVIHSMNASFRDPHHFYLRLKTQAGTYIKEFVHGDFGRTKPNLCQLLKMDTDILELDVESVDVDWPPTIPE